MLSSPLLMARLGGVHVLEGVAVESAAHHGEQVLRLLCAFARHPTDVDRESALTAEQSDTKAGDQTGSNTSIQLAREDVVTAVRVATSWAAENPTSISSAESRLDLRGVNLADTYFFQLNVRWASLENANLRGARLWDADFTNAKLRDADLNGAHMSDTKFVAAELWDAILSDADLMGANFEGADLWDAILSDANMTNATLSNANLAGANLQMTRLEGADLSSATFTKDITFNLDPSDCEALAESEPGRIVHDDRLYAVAYGITQSQLDSAVANPEHPPNLKHVVDAETGEPLVWRGGTPS